MAPRTTKPLDTDRFIKEIMSGRHDGRLGEIGQACNGRLISDFVRSGWSFDIGSFMRAEPLIVRDDKLTWEEGYLIESLTGVQWAAVLVDPRASLSLARACAIAIGKTEGYDFDAMTARMSERGSLEAVLEYFDLYEITEVDESADPLGRASSEAPSQT